MIGKRIRRGERKPRAALARLAVGVSALAQYVVDARPWPLDLPGTHALMRYALDLGEMGYEPGEKVEGFGTFNLIRGELPDWQAQLIAIAARGPRMRDPVEHIVISWNDGEDPSKEQAEEAAAIFLDVSGYGRCPALWALHTNTRHAHIHIMVVRIDPATGAAQGDGWDLDRLHQALALIEKRQGWAPEPNAIYEARGGAVYERRTGRIVRDAGGEQIAHRKHGRVLPPEIAVVADQLRASIEHASGWEDLHFRMGQLDADYDRKGSGAVIRREGAECKASELGPKYGRGELEKRLGRFQARASSIGYFAYQEACRSALGEARLARDTEKARLRAWFEATLVQIGSDNPVLTAAIRAEYQAALASLVSAFALAMDGFAKARLNEGAWHAAGDPPAAPRFVLPSMLFPASGGFRESRATMPRTFTRERRGHRTSYITADGSCAFEDARLFILVYRSDNETIDAALRLASSRWGSVMVFGSKAFRDKCLARASALEIDAMDDHGRRARAGAASTSKSNPAIEGRPTGPAPAPPQPEKPPGDDNVNLHWRWILEQQDRFR
ncbi:MAG TPA: relaxase/mobilization nuclease domain-containing protein [Allosphingosinicella sp.]|nr:relaxase/mobilization nuclease domain-containing protein [Allosphingosinicella sp.]